MNFEAGTRFIFSWWGERPREPQGRNFKRCPARRESRPTNPKGKDTALRRPRRVAAQRIYQTPTQPHSFRRLTLRLATETSQRNVPTLLIAGALVISQAI